MKPFIIHPWELLLDELEARGQSQTLFAKIIWRTRQEVNHLITWRRPINAEWALEISAALWTDPQYWLNLQNIYDIQTLESQNETPNLFQIKERAREFAYA